MAVEEVIRGMQAGDHIHTEQVQPQAERVAVQGAALASVACSGAEYPVEAEPAVAALRALFAGIRGQLDQAPPSDAAFAAQQQYQAILAGSAYGDNHESITASNAAVVECAGVVAKIGDTKDTIDDVEQMLLAALCEGLGRVAVHGVVLREAGRKITRASIQAVRASETYVTQLQNP